MMGGDDDEGDTIVETQEISSENLFHRRAEADPALTNWAREGAKVGGQHLTGEDGGGAAAAADWMAAAAVTADSTDGWVSSQADFIVSRRLLAVTVGGWCTRTQMAE